LLRRSVRAFRGRILDIRGVSAQRVLCPSEFTAKIGRVIET
jgi:hypothetical protein